jgi:ceramide glucosyltransferase
LWLRETRWLRTIRSVNAMGFSSLFITFASPWLALGAALGAALAWCPRLALAGSAAGVAMGWMTLAGVIARIAVHARGCSGWRAFWRALPLVPLRDGLLLLQWCAAAFGSHVVWRDARMAVSNADGNTQHPGAIEASDR